MILVHVWTHQSDGSRTAEVRVARNTSVYLCLMQARSQGLEFDLEHSRFFLDGNEVARSNIEETPVTAPGIILVQPQPADKRDVVVLD